VGVVADEKQDALDADVQPEVYAPHVQDSPNEMALLVRAAAAPDALLPAIKRAVAAVDSAVAIYDVRTMEAVIERTLAEERFSTLLLSAFALTALLLAAIGLYGIVAFTVNERAREIGVRIALGATRSNVLTMVVWGGLRVVLTGIVLGIAGALLVSRMLAAFLFQTQATDPLVLATVAVLLVGAGLAAAGLPAWRASRLDPAISLRAE
jgi:ABC-type antimicrobial peptide transport system permease subunit